MNSANRQKFMNMFNTMLDQKQTQSFMNKAENSSQRGDDIDRLNEQKAQALEHRLDQRNILFLKKVQEAKQKIIDGTYGVCEDCGSDISQKRLLARPMACLCINCQEEKERGEFLSFSKRRDLNNKQISAENLDEDFSSKNEKFSSVKDIKFESVVDL